jgi:hypothetical protein
MSVAQLSTTALNKLFLEFIKPGLEQEFYINTTIYNRFKTNTEACMGKYGVLKLLTASAKSARPSSSSTFPTAKQSTYDEFIMYMKRGMYATLQFDGLAVAVGKGKGAVKDLVKAETESIMLYIPHKLNKQFWGDGSGRLAQLYAAITGAVTGYVNGPLFGQDSSGLTPFSRYIAEGMSVDIYDTSGNLEAEDVEISTIVEGTSYDTLTFAETVTASNNAYLFDHDTYAASEAAGIGVPMGLYGIINSANPYIGITASTAFQNINRAAKTWAQAQVFNMDPAGGTTKTVITSKKILEAVQQLERYGTVNVIISNDYIWRAYYSILEADKTMPNEPAFWGGCAGLSFYGGKSKRIPMIYDEDCPDNRVYFIDDKRIQIIAPESGGMDWLPGESGNILSRVQGKDEYSANLRWYYNMSTNLPKALGVMTYVKHAEA